VAAVALFALSVYATAAGPPIQWDGLLKPDSRLPYKVTPEESEGNVRVRIRNEPGAEPTLVSFTTAIPLSCDDGSAEKLHFEYHEVEDTDGITITVKRTEVGGDRALAFALYEKRQGEETLSVRGTLKLEGKSPDKYSDGQGKLWFFGIVDGQGCRSMAAPACRWCGKPSGCRANSRAACGGRRVRPCRWRSYERAAAIARKPARTSATNSSGTSIAAKWPPRSSSR
jgi:hypothetical protein